ncbi:protein KRTCAP2 homolog [Paramacrobiotus metropolitanus]|uniref:protein KRTCAP2 homolog n=1 Tax=Paramacrobiotus metropolitanus TaxID=2943436 RepID=UPI002445D083|nr:protein KRTCAP2 homolog [Paramacrobiotus metropolitanus]
MAVSAGTSGLIAVASSILLIGAMQLFKAPLSNSQPGTVLGGFLGSQLFVLLLTAVSNFEMSAFGPGFQARVFPEIVSTLLIALFVAGSVHRVCVTTCLLFSFVSLYYLNKMSGTAYGNVTSAQAQVKSKRK